MNTLTWVISVIMIAILLVALANLNNAFLKLKGEEAECKSIASGPTNSFQAALKNLLSRNSDRLVVRGMRSVLYSGRLDSECLAYSEWIQVSRYVAGVFVFLGLMGTVLGIGFSVYNLGETVSATANLSTATSSVNSTSSVSMESLNNLLIGIKNLLVGMKTASVCTFLGLVLTLVLSALNTRYHICVQRLTEKIEKLASDHFYRLWQENNQQGEIATLSNAANQLQSAADTFSLAADQLENSVDEAQNFFPQITSGAKDLFLEVNQVVSELRTESQQASDERKKFKTEITRATSLLSANYAALGDRVSSLDTSILSVKQYYEDLQNDSNNLIKSAIAGLEQYHKGLYKDSASAVQQTIDSLKQYQASLDYTANTLHSAANNVDQSMKTLQAEFLRSLQERDAQMEKVLALVRQEMNATRRDGRQSQANTPNESQQTNQALVTMLAKYEHVLENSPSRSDLNKIRQEINGLRNDLPTGGQRPSYGGSSDRVYPSTVQQPPSPTYETAQIKPSPPLPSPSPDTPVIEPSFGERIGRMFGFGKRP